MMFSGKEKKTSVTTSEATKVIIIGDCKAGKTELVRRLNNEEYVGEYKRSIGIDFFSIYVSLPNDLKQVFQFWDIGGKEKRSNMLSAYTKEAIIFVYVVDSSQERETIQKSLESWKASLEAIYLKWDHLPETLLVFTKSDAISLQENHILRLAKENGFKDYVVCSARDNININSSVEGSGTSVLGKLVALAEDYNARVHPAPETDVDAGDTPKAKKSSVEAPAVDYEGVRSRCCNLF